MSTQEPEQDSALSKVARSVGSALGTVASKVNDIVGDKADADEKVAGDSAEPAETDPRSSVKSDAKSTKASGSAAPAKAVHARKSTAAKTKSRTQQVKKLKRDKHRRKLGRKTRG